MSMPDAGMARKAIKRLAASGNPSDSKNRHSIVTAPAIRANDVTADSPRSYVHRNIKKGKDKAVPETVFRLDKPFHEESFGKMAIDACSLVPVIAAFPPLEHLVHGVAIDAGLRICAQIRHSSGIEERVDCKTEHHAGHKSDGQYPSVAVPHRSRYDSSHCLKKHQLHLNAINVSIFH
jgi:hypothetical protein